MRDAAVKEDPAGKKEMPIGRQRPSQDSPIEAQRDSVEQSKLRATIAIVAEDVPAFPPARGHVVNVA